MPRTEPTFVFCYCLEGDGRKYFVKNAVFPTEMSLDVEVPAGFDRQFITKIGSGLPPFSNGLLTMLDSKLEPVYRYGWCNTTVQLLKFPAIDVQIASFVSLTVTFGVVDVQPVTDDPASGSGGGAVTVPGSRATKPVKRGINFYLRGGSTRKATSSDVAHTRRDPMVAMMIMMTVDGSDGVYFTKMGAFSVGQGGTYTLEMTGSEVSATPFRAWLHNGNARKSGKVEYFASNLQVAYRAEFQGLFVQSIYPAFPGGTPATVKLIFDSMAFYPVI